MNLIQRFNQLDHRLLDVLQESLRHPWLDRILTAVTHLGDLGAIWALWGVALFWVQRQQSLLLILAISLCALVCNLIMKPLFRRGRPFEYSREVDVLIAEPKDRSFPSGHTMASFTAAVLICTQLGGWQAVLALTLALLIALSRLYLGVHYPSDVLAGAVFGSVLGAAVPPLFADLAGEWAQWLTLILGI